MGFFVPAHRRGFTLVEVLFVVAIIVLLSSVVVVNISASKAKGRDTQRKSDIEQLQLALRLYKDAESGYPTFAEGAVVGDGGAFDTALADYLTGTIRDPLDRGEYQYYYDSSYNCGGSPRRVLIVLTMERESAGNHDSVCGSPGEDLGNGVTPTADSYVVVLR